MESGPERAICQGCGGEFPRAEMFGLEGDQRCPDCAHGLRERHHPSRVRRASMSFRPSSANPDGRATAGILAAAVVLWLSWQLKSPLKDFIDGTLEVWGRRLPEGFQITTRPPPWTFGLWAFLHGGIFHLLMNGLALWQIGRYIEWGWGRFTFATLLIGSAIAGTAAGWLVNGAPTIGLSGGIFAVDGWLIAQRRRHVVATAIVNRVFVNSLIAGSVLLVLMTELGGWRISHVGHAVGFLWGLAGGFITGTRRPALGWALLGAATLALVLLPSYVEPLGWDLTLFGKGR